MWFDLPVELQRQCLQQLDVPTLKSFRLVNKAVLELSTEILFGTVSLYPSDESAEKYTAILENETLRALVRTAIFNTNDDPDVDDSNRNREESDFLESYDEAVRKVSQFSNLREVQVKFARACAVESRTSGWDKEVAETVSFRTDVLLALFEGLDSEEHELEHFDTLTLKNLQDWVSEEIYTSPHFVAVLRKIRKLHLCIATESDEAAPEDSINKIGCHRMFNDNLIERWLKPVQGQLTHLSLWATECFWGFWPFCDLRATHFPHLKSLSLGNWTIVHDWQIDWILSHAPTLEELLLDDCPIVTVCKVDNVQVKPHFPDLEPVHVNERFNTKTYVKEIALRWHEALAQFRTGLPHLKHFALGQGNWDEGTMFEERYELLNELRWDRYHVFDKGIGPSQWMGGGGYWVLARARAGQEWEKRSHKFVTGGKGRDEFLFPNCDKKDLETLVELLEAVEERAGARV
ncbi:hypothetical protein N0V90_006027 [Kalmusia sp. IMI 367209]|nr:hypothetical protein N0V90_006027 [Kalmusia sp. IMI 367209]